MSTDHNLLAALRTDIETEDRAAISRTKIGIGIRAVLIVFVFGYMTWISNSVSRLDAGELTRIAAVSVQEKIPEWSALFSTTR